MSKLCIHCGRPFTEPMGNYCSSKCRFDDESGEPKPPRVSQQLDNAKADVQYMYVRLKRNGEHWPNIIREKGSNRLIRVCYGHLIPRE